MPKFTVKVNNDDEGEDLGEYEADYLPRVGDDFALWHPRVCEDEDATFLGVVDQVRHEATAGDKQPNGTYDVGVVHTTVWLVEEHAPPVLYCDCTPEERERLAKRAELGDGQDVDEDGVCGDCRGKRRDE